MLIYTQSISWSWREFSLVCLCIVKHSLFFPHHSKGKGSSILPLFKSRNRLIDWPFRLLQVFFFNENWNFCDQKPLNGCHLIKHQSSIYSNECWSFDWRKLNEILWSRGQEVRAIILGVHHIFSAKILKLNRRSNYRDLIQKDDIFSQFWMKKPFIWRSLAGERQTAICDI